MMSPVSFHPAIREGLAVHEAFRRLGYQSEEIFVTPPIEARKAVFVVLKSGGKTFSYDAGPCDIPLEEFQEKWIAAVEWWNRSEDEAARTEIYKESYVRKNSMMLLMMLHRHGFTWRDPDAN